jgi:hypothetical protein
MTESLVFTTAENKAYRDLYGKDATDSQWQIFLSECQRRRLIPGIHVIFQLRNSSEWDQQLQQVLTVKRVAFITTINALRLIAERGAKYEGHEPFKYIYTNEEGKPLSGVDIPEGRVPHAVSVEGYRKDWKKPLMYVARYDAYVQLKKKGNVEVPTFMWEKRGEEQLAKCAEAGMLRTLAPEECGNLYIEEEMPLEIVQAPASQQPVQPPKPLESPAVNQEAATMAATMAPFVPPALPTPQMNVEETIHKTARILDKQIGEPLAPKKEESPLAAGGLFTGLDVNAKPVEAPKAPAAPATNSTTEASRSKNESAQSTVIPTKAVLPPYQATDEDLPKGFLTPAITTTASIAAPTPQALQVPATKEEQAAFGLRAKKIIYDRLAKAMTLDEAGRAFKAYMMKDSGCDKTTQLSAAYWEGKLARLEQAGVTKEALLSLMAS